MTESEIIHVIADTNNHFVPMYRDHIWDHNYEHYQMSVFDIDMCNYFDLEGQSWAGELEILKSDIPHYGDTL